MPKAGKSDGRLSRIKARLKEGFTVEQLKQCVNGALLDDWLMGTEKGSRKGGYRDVVPVFRDMAQVERLIELAGEQADPEPKIYDQDDPTWAFEPPGVPMPKEFEDALSELTGKR